MYHPPIKIRKGLKPLSWFYGIGVEFRHKLFDAGILKSKTYPVPVICVGNITVGGTGKTPHVEYLIRILSPEYRVAIISRGYKRKSSGFRKVEIDSTVKQVGDEPLQIKRKFPNAAVYVDANRQHAIEHLLKLPENEKPDVILLDDAYQHRYVTPSLSILLMDSKRPIYEDALLPAGNLRESQRHKSRASIVLVTKCSHAMNPIDFRIIEKGLDLFSYQALYFTSFEYKAIQPVFPDINFSSLSNETLKQKQVLLIAGIANPHPLVERLKKQTAKLHTLFYPDHHAFSKKDIIEINKQFDDIESDEKIILTTEKDAMRLRENSAIDDALQQKLYFIPIQVIFTQKKTNQEFNKKIKNHVRKYQTNS